MTLATKLAGLRAVMQFDNRWQLLVNRGLFRESLNLYRIRDIEFLEDHRLGDANGARELLTTQMYRPFLERLRKDSSQSAWTVADFGASNAGFPLLLHISGFTLSRVVAVEMNPNIFPRLRFNLEHNVTSLSRGGSPLEMELYNVAIGGARRNVHVSSHGGTGGRILEAPELGGQEAGAPPSGTASVPVWLPEDVLKGRTFDLLKIDIEGAEHEVFSAGKHQCFRRCRYIIMEIHNGVGNPRTILDEMRRIGFASLDPASECEESTAVHAFARMAES